MKKKVIIYFLLFLTIISITGCKEEYTFADINDETDFDIPIDETKEAVIYSKNIPEFKTFRDHFKNATDWLIETEYVTEKKHKNLFESWLRSGKIDREEYEGMIKRSESEGDYWQVYWNSDNAFCVIQFRKTGELKNITSSAISTLPFNCGHWLE